MSEWKWWIFDTAICAFEIYIYHDFITHMMVKPESSAKVKHCILTILWAYVLIVNSFATQLLGIFINTEAIDRFLFQLFHLESLSGLFLNLLLIPFGLFCACHLLFQEDEVRRKISLTCVYYTISTVIEMIGGLIGERQLNLQAYDYSSTVILVLTEKVVTFMIIKFLIRCKPAYTKTDRKFFTMFLLLPMSTVLINLGILFVTRTSPDGIENKLWFIVGDMCLLISNGAVFYIYEKHMEALQNMQQQQLKNLKSEYNEKYYHSLAEENAKYASLAHDYKNQIRTIQILAQKGNDEKIADLTQAIQEQNAKIHQFTNYCNNDILNAVLCANIENAQAHDIRFSLDIQPGFSCDMISDFDICVIFGNLLENALEGADKCERDRFVRCVLYYKDYGQIIHVNIINSYVVNSLRMDRGRLLTSKSDRFSHGIGLKNVRDVVETAYDGTFSYEASDDGIFTVMLTFTAQ